MPFILKSHFRKGFSQCSHIIAVRSMESIIRRMIGCDVLKISTRNPYLSAVRIALEP